MSPEPNEVVILDERRFPRGELTVHLYITRLRVGS